MTETHFGFFCSEQLTIDAAAGRARIPFFTIGDEHFSILIFRGESARFAQRALLDQRQRRITSVTGERSPDRTSLTLTSAGLLEFHGTLTEEADLIANELTGSMVVHQVSPPEQAADLPQSTVSFSIPLIESDPRLEPNTRMVILGALAGDSDYPAIKGATAACMRPEPTAEPNASFDH